MASNDVLTSCVEEDVERFLQSHGAAAAEAVHKCISFLYTAHNTIF